MKYLVTGTNIKHNGKLYKAGSVIEIEKTQALEKFLIPIEPEEKKKKGVTKSE